jgi:hypothetical protein
MRGTLLLSEDDVEEIKLIPLLTTLEDDTVKEPRDDEVERPAARALDAASTSEVEVEGVVAVPVTSTELSLTVEKVTAST